MKKNKIDTRSTPQTLTSNPFGALNGLRGNLPESAPEEEPAAKRSAPSAPYRVGKTRKGGWPVSVERRNNGWVTVIKQVEGDGDALLKRLRNHCACGGALREDQIEIQGDHRDKISAALTEWLS